ncbi:ribosomal L7Ae/L30e/S12e/Gadd45 family protein [Candidatus Woesearchaeota archaeon]|nr:ribosomal L7Ae/L30e/S12e/Gadd45 family protein [Candidatus Woesearchaeota archaeon]
MAKQTLLQELQKLAEAGKIVYGSKETVHALKKGTAVKVFVSRTAPITVKEDITHYASLGNILVVELAQSASELGTLCKKPFDVSVAAVTNE